MRGGLLRKTSLAALAAAMLLSAGTASRAAEFWHYLTASGEHEAVQALMEVVAKLHPDTPITEHPVPGSQDGLRQQLQIAFLGGTPPATWESNVGAELLAAVDAKRVQPIDDVWAEVGGDKIFPPGLAKVLKSGGHAYAIPINQGIISNIFYNKKMFEKLGLTPPKTWDEFKAIGVKLRAAGIEPMGAASGPWNLYQFYGPLVATIGMDGYYALASGKMAFDGPEMHKAFHLYKDTYVDNYMKNWKGLQWTQTADQMVAGKIAMYADGDWISSYMKQKGFQPGVDFDFFPAPMADVPVVIVQTDCFPLAANISAADEAAAKNFLRAAASPEGQAAFNKIKGSLAANSNTPTDIYDYTGKNEFALASGATTKTLVNMFALLPPKLLPDFYGAVERYGADPTDATLDTLLSALEAERQELLEQKAFTTY